MKKILLAIALVLGISSAARADGGDLALGVHFLNGSSQNQMGIGVKVQCGLSGDLRLEPSFDYWFEKESVSTWDVAINLQQVVEVTSNFCVFPLAGLGYSRWTIDLGSGSNQEHDRIFFDLGLGGEVAMSSCLWLTAEMTYQLMTDYGQFVPKVGVKVCF